jgi:hypothetical protein
MDNALDYKTHILIGVRRNGGMDILYYWPNVPKQAEVEARIYAAKMDYTTYMLCTPTSILLPQERAS